MSRSERGFTMMEIMMTVAIGAVVIGGISRLNTRQFTIESAVRDHLGVEWDKSDAGIAAMKIAHLLPPADRVNILSEDPGHLQYRLFRPQQDNAPTCPVGSCTTPGAAPAACCFDIAANYQWEELRYDGASRQLIWYPAEAVRCSRAVRFTGHLATVVFRYQDTAAALPPGGDPAPAVFGAAPADPNMLAYSVRWDNGEGLTRQFNGTVALQGLPYSDVQAGATGPADSGWGLGAGDVAPPPSPACS